MIAKAPSKEQRENASLRAGKASRWHHESNELDIKLDLALGAPEDLRDYQDCIRAARGKERRAP